MRLTPREVELLRRLGLTSREELESFEVYKLLHGRDPYSPLREFLEQCERSKPIMLEILKFFECRRCGECCRTVPVELGTDDIAALCRHLRMSPEEFDSKYLRCLDDLRLVIGPPCPFLEGNACTVYAARPGPCRLYPFREDMVLDANCPLGAEILDWVEKNMGVERVSRTAPLETCRSLLGLSPLGGKGTLLVGTTYFALLEMKRRLEKERGCEK